MFVVEKGRVDRVVLEFKDFVVVGPRRRGGVDVDDQVTLEADLDPFDGDGRVVAGEEERDADGVVGAEDAGRAADRVLKSADRRWRCGRFVMGEGGEGIVG